MAEGVSDWQRFKLWGGVLRIAYQLSKLRKSGELQRILDASAYDYLRPDSFQGDDWFHVHLKGSKRQDDFLYSSLRENQVLWWIVERHLQEAR
jgi:hypothetical protein